MIKKTKKLRGREIAQLSLIKTERFQDCRNNVNTLTGIKLKKDRQNVD